jgi:WD40 repeat protein
MIPQHRRVARDLALLAVLTVSANACAHRSSAQSAPGNIAQIYQGKIAPHYSGDMALSPDGKALALLMNKRGAEIWDLVNGTSKVLPNPRGETGAGSVTFSKDGQFLARSHGHSITIWAIKEAREIVRIPHEGGGMPMVFTDADRTLAATDRRQVGDDPNPLNDHATIVRWDVRSGDEISSVDFGPLFLFEAISPDGRYGVAHESNGSLAGGVYDLTTRAKLFGLLKLGDSTFWEDGSRVVHLVDNWLSILEVPSGKELKRLDTKEPFSSSHVLSLSSKANTLAVGRYAKSNLTSIISLESGKILGTIECGDPLMICERVRLSSDGRTLVTGTYGVNSHDQPVEPSMKIWRLPEKW